MSRCGEYFETFLPEIIGKSLIAKMESLNLTFCISIPDEGDWTVFLDGGKLKRIEVGKSKGVEVCYTLDQETFLNVVTGKVSSQRAFFSGKVKIEGDMLKALKFANIFQHFVERYPFTSKLELEERRG